MHVDLEHIAALAEVDAERERVLREIRDRKAAIEQAALGERDAARARDAAYAELEAAQAAERDANKRMVEHRHRHSQAAKALDLSSSGSEALERQLQHTLVLADHAETEVIEAMELQDRLRNAVADAERAAVIAAAAKKEVDGRVPGEIAKLEVELGAADARRLVAISALGHDLAERYELIYKKKRVAIARVEDSTCTGCQRLVPAQQISDLKAGRSTEVCRGCGRWLIPVK